ncbi:hypothetical protein PFISCL1PPCAC_10320, partial [Pristionchus fissidentatus]
VEMKIKMDKSSSSSISLSKTKKEEEKSPYICPETEALKTLVDFPELRRFISDCHPDIYRKIEQLTRKN